jgi:uncharacterized protein
MPDVADLSKGRPMIHGLTREECFDVLRRHTYGRIAFALHGRIDIEPIHYVLDGEFLYLRTSWGTKVQSLRHGPWVAFEVDEVRGPFDWTSVVVKGTTYFVPAESQGGDPRAYERTLGILRRLIPEAMTPDDPVPDRDVLMRVSINEVRGRRAVPPT